MPVSELFTLAENMHWMARIKQKYCVMFCQDARKELLHTTEINLMPYYLPTILTELFIAQILLTESQQEESRFPVLLFH